MPSDHEFTSPQSPSNVQGDRLQQARKARGLTQQAVADSLKMARTTVVAIEKGERKIQPDELVKMARLYGRTVGDFIGRKMIVSPFIPQFRMQAGMKADEESAIFEAVGELQSLAEDYLELEGLNDCVTAKEYPPCYDLNVPDVNPDQLGEDAAASERARLGLGDGPVPDLRVLLEESMGIRIFYLDLPSRIGGIFACNDQLGACIAVNRNHPPQRGNWSLAHEFGHFMSTRYQADVDLIHGSWNKHSAEKFADAFARNFLMPRTGISRRLSDMVKQHGKGVTIADVVSLASLFKVSVEAMFRRLEELKRLPSGTWENLKEKGFKPDQARRNLGHADKTAHQPMLPMRYRMLAKNAYEDRDALTESQLTKLLRTDRVSARLELERLDALADSALEDGWFQSFDLPDLARPVLVSPESA